MKLNSVLTAFFAVHIIALSFVPFVRGTLLAQKSWVVYGTGAYALQSQHDFVLSATRSTAAVNRTFM